MKSSCVVFKLGNGIRGGFIGYGGFWTVTRSKGFCDCVSTGGVFCGGIGCVGGGLFPLPHFLGFINASDI